MPGTAFLFALILGEKCQTLTLAGYWKKGIKLLEN